MLDFIKKLFSKKKTSKVTAATNPTQTPDNASPVTPDITPNQPQAVTPLPEHDAYPTDTKTVASVPVAPVLPTTKEQEQARQESAFSIGSPAPIQGADTNKARQTTQKKPTKITAPNAMPAESAMHSAPVEKIEAPKKPIGPLKANLPNQPNVGTNEVNTGAINIGSNLGSAFLSVVNGHFEARNHPDNQGSYVQIKALTPTKYNDLTNKAYVDAITSGYTITATADSASTGTNINLATGLENGGEVDQFIIFTGQLTIVKDQTDPTQNGVYVINWQGAPTRYPAANLINGNIFYVTQGITNHETFWQVQGTFTGPGGAPNYGVDAIHFVPITMHPGSGGSVNLSGSAPIVVTNPTAGSYNISLSASGVTAGTYNTLTVGTNGIVTFGTNVPYSGSGTVTQIDTGTGLVGGPITTSGTISMTPTGVTPGTYGNANNVPEIVINDLGQITSATNVPVSTGLFWNNVPGTTQTMSPNNGYITSNPSLTTVTLPVIIPQGAVVAIAGANAGGWKLAQNASQTIHFGNQNSTTGTAGSITSTERYDYVELLCIVANTDFIVKASAGNLFIT